MSCQSKHPFRSTGGLVIALAVLFSAQMVTAQVGKDRIGAWLDSGFENETASVCADGSGPLVAVLGLSWDVPPSDAAARRFQEGARLDVVNRHRHPVDGVFRANLSAGASMSELEPVSFKLKAGESASFVVEPHLEQWDWQQIRSSGTIRAQVAVRGSKRHGTPEQVLRAEPLFFHRDGADLLFYSGDALVNTFRGGDFTGEGRRDDAPNYELYQFAGTGLPLTYDPLSHTPKDTWELAPFPERFIPYGQYGQGGDSGTSVSPFGDLASYRQVCLNLDSDFEDGSVGDYLIDYWSPALGVRYHLGIPWVGTYTGYASRSTGCFSLPVNPTTDYYVTIFFESRVGYGNRNLLLRSFGDFEVNGDVPWSFENWVAGGKKNEDVPRNSIHVWPSPGFSTVHLATHPANVTLANLLAVASHGVTRLEEATKPPPSNASTLRKMELIPRDCPNKPVGTSCAGNSVTNSYSELSISPEGSDTHRKFLIGHEVGHWYHLFQAGSYPPMDYSLDSVFEGCQSGNIVGLHALRSKEEQGGALVEGFAHFLSAYVFNAASGSDGWFKYYKQHDEYGYNYDLVDLLGSDSNATGGPADVLHNVCGCADGDCTDGYGVELDWLRHYWRFYRDPGTKPAMAELFEQLAAAHPNMGETNVFFPLRDALNGALRTRWEQLGLELGADSTPW